MSFMVPEVRRDWAYLIETSGGTFCVPAGIGYSDVRPQSSPDNPAWREQLADYVPTIDDDSTLEVLRGFVYRLSAPGYLDSTDWGFADTEAEAYSELLALYGTDYGEREEWELEAISIVLAAETPSERARLIALFGVTVDDDGNVSDAEPEA